eukprot:Gb_16047 [translate_table: standard]
MARIIRLLRSEMGPQVAKKGGYVPSKGNLKSFTSSNDYGKPVEDKIMGIASFEKFFARVGIFKTLSQTLWGKGLPHQIVVGAVQTIWSSGRKIMMKQMAPSDPTSSYRRPNNNFHGGPLNPMESSEIRRYHLKRKLSEYPNLHGYMLDIYQMPRVASTCDLQAIMDGYYRSMFLLNPRGIQRVWLCIALFWAAINVGDRVDSALKDMAIVMKQQDHPQDAIKAIKQQQGMQYKCVPNSEVGQVMEVRLAHRNSQTQKNKGFAFIHLGTVEQAKKVVTNLKNPKVVEQKVSLPHHNIDKNAEQNGSLQMQNIYEGGVKQVESLANGGKKKESLHYEFGERGP